MGGLGVALADKLSDFKNAASKVKSLFLCDCLKGKHRDSSSVIGRAAAVLSDNYISPPCWVDVLMVDVVDVKQSSSGQQELRPKKAAGAGIALPIRRPSSSSQR